MSRKRIYRIGFIHRDEIYEIYARGVGQSSMAGFVEVSDLLFGESSELLVDPSEERLKNEFNRIKRTYIPVHAILRIDEVEKEGHARVMEAEGTARVTPFSVFTPDENSD
ncbi:MAG TPA: DUF1820 family protein [Mariprofundaceae bacterium]|nr:DUF1820 family protein [Mariprofundaceae bacterium]